ncbi:hypothetical protein HGQ17_02765 [Nesterenkonia sp. MY13]|uniref:Uncharacterized protein n=1 Tax=Nesterenkonia sedimenti TaxID=1463632 RepID=A0A7X8TI87_9MICC|nr:hypothetical protein [Nesterenkonia sedimenti]NLS08940.1 hypothetical protein [Nesterenkonia sedimenti]
MGSRWSSWNSGFDGLRFRLSGDEYEPRAYSEGGDYGVETAEFVEQQTYQAEGLHNQYDDWAEDGEIADNPAIAFPVEERENYERICRERLEDAEVDDLEAGEMTGWLQETDRGEVTGVLAGVYGEHTTVTLHSEGTDAEVIRNSLDEIAEYIEDQLAEIED